MILILSPLSPVSHSLPSSYFSHLSSLPSQLCEADRVCCFCGPGCTNRPLSRVCLSSFSLPCSHTLYRSPLIFSLPFPSPPRPSVARRSQSSRLYPLVSRPPSSPTCHLAPVCVCVCVFVCYCMFVCVDALGLAFNAFPQAHHSLKCCHQLVWTLQAHWQASTPLSCPHQVHNFVRLRFGACLVCAPHVNPMCLVTCLIFA